MLKTTDLRPTQENIKKAQEFIGTLLNNLPNVVNITKTLLKVTAAYAGVLVGITAGKFFTVLLTNMGTLLKITRSLLNLEKLKLGVLKAQAVLQAALSGGIKIKGQPLYSRQPSSALASVAPTNWGYRNLVVQK